MLHPVLLYSEIIMQILRDVTQGLRFLHTNRPPIFHGVSFRSRKASVCGTYTLTHLDAQKLQDLKGRNILIDLHFRAKLCDFGLSAKKNRISGTPYFLAPEYLRGKKAYDAQVSSLHGL